MKNYKKVREVHYHGKELEVESLFAKGLPAKAWLGSFRKSLKTEGARGGQNLTWGYPSPRNSR